MRVCVQCTRTHVHHVRPFLVEEKIHDGKRNKQEQLVGLFPVDQFSPFFDVLRKYLSNPKISGKRSSSQLVVVATLTDGRHGFEFSDRISKGLWQSVLHGFRASFLQLLLQLHIHCIDPPEDLIYYLWFGPTLRTPSSSILISL